MLTLILLRHAKSSWDDVALDDFERPLAERGRTAAPLMGAYLASQRVRPDLVLCSSSVRTRETLDLVLPHLGTPRPDVSYEDGLYLASASDLQARLRSVAGRWPTVMMIGHNPGFHDFAISLVASGPAEARAALATKFPTAGLAIVTFPGPAWTHALPRTARLTCFMSPSRLATGAASGA